MTTNGEDNNRDPGASALAALHDDDVKFLWSLPKAELHAHLNGCIPLNTLQLLARDYTPSPDSAQSDVVQNGLAVLEKGIHLREIHEFFDLFPAIYALTSTPAALKTATRAVLQQFLEPGYVHPDGPAQCACIELRSTPRKTSQMTREQYLEAVLDEVERYPEDKAAFIASLDRQMSKEEMTECVEIAVKLKENGRRIVGIDLCGRPTVGDAETFLPALHYAQSHGLAVTLHIAETRLNTVEDMQTLLSCTPNRLGHATFLDSESKQSVLHHGIPIEICLSSNLLTKTTQSLQGHHIVEWLKHGIPLAICTDDTLVFRNNLIEEYAMLLAQPPLGLGLSRAAVSRIAEMSMQARFAVKTD